MRIAAAGDTDIGQVRQANEDTVLVGSTVFVVADGMGGAAGGRVASATAVESLADLDGSRFGDPTEAERAVHEAVAAANRAVHSTAGADPRLQGMGTTLTAVLVDGEDIYIGHVGDSRAYLLRDGELRQLTRDHSLVQQLVDMGRLTEEEAANHPQAAIITRALGLAPEVEVDVETLRPRPGDRLLLCTDGLTGMLDELGIQGCLESIPDRDEVVATLIERANQAGGRDNIGVVILDFLAD